MDSNIKILLYIIVFLATLLSCESGTPAPLTPRPTAAPTSPPCDAGQEFYNGSCRSCQENYYKPDFSRSPCIECFRDSAGRQAKSYNIPTSCYFFLNSPFHCDFSSNNLCGFEQATSVSTIEHFRDEGNWYLRENITGDPTTAVWVIPNFVTEQLAINDTVTLVSPHVQITSCVLLTLVIRQCGDGVYDMKITTSQPGYNLWTMKADELNETWTEIEFEVNQQYSGLLGFMAVKEYIGNGSIEFGDVRIRPCHIQTTPAPHECKAGYGVDNDICTHCPLNFYKNSIGRLPCSPCPADRFNTRGRTLTTASTECYFDPYLAWLYPGYGPVSGGTKVIFIVPHVQNHQVDYLQLVDTHPVNVTRYNDSETFIARSPNRTEDMSAAGIVRVLISHKTTGITTNLTMAQAFQYRPDPIILWISRNSTVRSGGLSFNVVGKFLTSVADPKARVVVRAPNYEQVFTSECGGVNSTHMYCLYPDLSGTPFEVKNGSGPGGSNRNVVFHVGFELDGITTYEEFKQIVVYNDPVFSKFEEHGNIKEFNPNEDSTISIKGTLLDQVLTARDITVLIGDGNCEVIYLATDLLRCEPPKVKPGFGEAGEGPKDSVTVEVSFGKVKSVPGFLKYTENTPNWLLIGVTTGVSVFVVVCVVVLVCLIRRRTPKSSEEKYFPPDLYGGEKNKAFTLPEHMNRWSIPPDNVQVGRCIGKGQFGQVYMGTLHSEDSAVSKPVAIKTVKPDNSTATMVEEFLDEALVMTGFSHPNIVQMYGIVVFDDNPHVVLEFMNCGDLKNYIADPDKQLVPRDMLWFSLQVAQGMAHLSSHRCVHRDLAARNCMINSDQVVKIADFGLARDIYMNDYYRTEHQRPLPIKWMAVESMVKGMYTTKSDVWSFGVLMWELFTRGDKPYADVDNYKLKDYIKLGQRLQPPEYCTPEIFAIMRSCWHDDPKDRPTFEELEQELQGLLNPKGAPGYVDLYQHAAKASKHDEGYMMPGN